jgi:hypothetical protein
MVSQDRTLVEIAGQRVDDGLFGRWTHSLTLSHFGKRCRILHHKPFFGFEGVNLAQLAPNFMVALPTYICSTSRAWFDPIAYFQSALRLQSAYIRTCGMLDKGPSWLAAACSF